MLNVLKIVLKSGMLYGNIWVIKFVNILILIIPEKKENARSHAAVAVLGY